jgi:phosphoglycolate phosphatase
LAEILSLNGKPTIHQINAFAHRLEREAGISADPEQLFNEYERNLRGAIDQRCAMQESAGKDAFVVHGARQMIEMLRSRNVTPIILSGTVETEVRAEAALLGLSNFFGEHIYGSVRGKAFSKKDVIERIVRKERIEGHHLLSFGDGPVEIEFTKAAGGLAIGVASDEDENGSHWADPFKREQLVRAGADAIIADYACAEQLLFEIYTR